MDKIKKDKNKNPFLKPDGSLELIEKFPGIDFNIYEEERIKKQKAKKKLKELPEKEE